MNLYDGRTREDWLLEIKTMSQWMKRHALIAFALLGIPDSLLDVGCGTGYVVTAAHALGVEAYGVDQLVEKDDRYFFHANLVNKFTLKKPVTMVWCTEVAEHLDQSAHATLCDTCADNLAVGRGHYLLFSSAYPNQGGSGHISERPAKYWLSQFARRDLNYRKDLTVSLSLMWNNIGSPFFWLASNILVFEK